MFSKIWLFVILTQIHNLLQKILCYYKIIVLNGKFIRTPIIFREESVATRALFLQSFLLLFIRTPPRWLERLVENCAWYYPQPYTQGLRVLLNMLVNVKIYRAFLTIPFPNSSNIPHLRLSKIHCNSYWRNIRLFTTSWHTRY